MKEQFSAARKYMRQNGIKFRGTQSNPQWDPYVFNVLSGFVGKATAGRLIHRGLVA